MDTNYDLLMQRLDEVVKDNEKLRKDFDEIVAFNRTLLNRSESVKENTGSSRKEELRKKLEGGLKRG